MSRGSPAIYLSVPNYPLAGWLLLDKLSLFFVNIVQSTDNANFWKAMWTGKDAGTILVLSQLILHLLQYFPFPFLVFIMIGVWNLRDILYLINLIWILCLWDFESILLCIEIFPSFNSWQLLNELTIIHQKNNCTYKILVIHLSSIADFKYTLDRPS